ncbi:hypothetical protein GCM10009793_35490 [Brachybacterium phenoliresistens]|uniref:Uncharacterized protein n=1 Tax=Brachybacterium phenoliresistens TaxID=396014 RepID=Z9JVC5_9MICO|nr:hypothetical protein BF93_15835 [Brachybacterium phenoliresistens]
MHVNVYTVLPPLYGLEESWPRGADPGEKCEVDTESSRTSYLILNDDVWRIQTLMCFPMPVGFLSDFDTLKHTI